MAHSLSPSAIRALRIMRNPDKLAYIRRQLDSYQ